MILHGIEEIQKLLPSVNLRLDSTRLDDFMLRAQQWVADNIIGSELESALEGEDHHADLCLRVKRVIAANAYLTFGDEMNLQLGEAGMTVQNNQSMSAASSQRRDNLMRSLEDRLDHDCDALVNYLLENSAEGKTYERWRDTEQFYYLTIAFLPTMKELHRHLPFKTSYTGHWADFNKSLLNVSIGMMDISASYVSAGEIVRLRELYRENGLNEVQHQAVFRLQSVAAACLVNDLQQARKSAIGARNTMLDFLDDFTSFAASDCVNMSDVNFDAGHIVDTI